MGAGRRVIVCLAVLFAATAAPLWAEEVPSERTQVYFDGPKTTVVTLEMAPDGKLYVPVAVQGRRLRFNLDTGASTILDVDIARQLALPQRETAMVGYGLTGGSKPRVRTQIDLTIGEITIKGMPVDCLPLAELSRISADHGLGAFDGLIGAEILNALGAVIDYRHLTLTLTRPGGF